MQPHKPRPNPRTVEVDLSAILIRPEEWVHREAGQNVESPDAFPGWRNWAISKPFPRVGSSDWANIASAIGASLIGLSYTLFMFDDFDHFRRSSLRPANAVTARVEMRALGAKSFPANAVLGHAETTQPVQSIVT